MYAYVFGDAAETLATPGACSVVPLGLQGSEFCESTNPLDIRQRGVQWMGGAVDGGHKWSNKQDTHTDNCQA